MHDVIPAVVQDSISMLEDPRIPSSEKWDRVDKDMQSLWGELRAGKEEEETEETYSCLLFLSQLKMGLAAGVCL